MIQAIERAIDILEFIAEKQGISVPLGEIAKATGLKLTTTANIIKTLMKRGCVEQPSPRKGYILGVDTYFFPGSAPSLKIFVKTCEPFMKKLADKIEEGVLLAKLIEGKINILYQIEGNQILRVNPEFIFQFSSPYKKATGKLLLAYLSEQELEGFIEKNGLPLPGEWSEAKNKSELKKVLAKIRKEKMATNVIREGENEIIGIGVPIEKKSRAIAALGLFLPLLRFKGEHKKTILRELKKTGEDINYQI